MTFSYAPASPYFMKIIESGPLCGQVRANSGHSVNAPFVSLQASKPGRRPGRGGAIQGYSIGGAADRFTADAAGRVVRRSFLVLQAAQLLRCARRRRRHQRRVFTPVGRSVRKVDVVDPPGAPPVAGKVACLLDSVPRRLLRATFCNHRESPDNFNFFESIILPPKIPFDELFLKTI